jgi:hypothetical protein
VVPSGTTRRGTSSAYARRTHSTWKARSPRLHGDDTSFARSRDPCTSIPTRLAVRKHFEVGRSLRYRGRANLRKQEEPAPGSERTDECAARRESPLSGQPEGSCVTRKKRKVVMAIVPARNRELRAKRPYVGCSCRSRQAASWPRISSHAALQKEWR